MHKPFRVFLPHRTGGVYSYYTVSNFALLSSEEEQKTVKWQPIIDYTLTIPRHLQWALRPLSSAISQMKSLPGRDVKN